MKNQLDATYYFIVLLIGPKCFGHYYAHHYDLATMMLIVTLVVSFFIDGGVSFNVNLWFLVVCVRCEVLCRFVVAGNVFLSVAQACSFPTNNTTFKPSTEKAS